MKNGDKKTPTPGHCAPTRSRSAQRPLYGVVTLDVAYGILGLMKAQNLTKTGKLGNGSVESVQERVRASFGMRTAAEGVNSIMVKLGYRINYPMEKACQER